MHNAWSRTVFFMVCCLFSPHFSVLPLFWKTGCAADTRYFGIEHRHIYTSKVWHIYGSYAVCPQIAVYVYLDALGGLCRIAGVFIDDDIGVFFIQRDTFAVQIVQ